MSIDTMVSQELPEGWYDDPENPRLQRWWTGTDWTDHVRHSAGPARSRLSFAGGLADPEPTFTQPTFASPDFVAPQIAAPSFAAPEIVIPSFVPSAFETPAAQSSVFDTPVTYIGGKSTAVSSASAIDDVSAYVPMSHYYMPTTARVGVSNIKSYSPSTGAVWFLALSPLIWTAIQLVARLSAPESAVTTLIVSAAVIVAMLIAVLADNVALRRRSIQPPAMAWFLLGTAPYFVARWWALRGQGIRYMAPGIGFAVAIIASVVVWAFGLGAL